MEGENEGSEEYGEIVEGENEGSEEYGEIVEKEFMGTRMKGERRMRVDSVEAREGWRMKCHLQLVSKLMTTKIMLSACSFNGSK